MTNKSTWYGRDIVEIDRFYPSSKLCSKCHYKNNELELKDRSWKCPLCGTEHDRDFNASINILKEGKRLYKEKIPIRNGELTPLESKSIDTR